MGLEIRTYTVVWFSIEGGISGTKVEVCANKKLASELSGFDYRKLSRHLLEKGFYLEENVMVLAGIFRKGGFEKNFATATQ